MSAQYSRTELSTEVATMVSGDYGSTDFVTAANRAVREVFLDIDLRSAKRKSALSPNLFKDVYQYTSPSDLKGLKIIDIKPQVKRGRLDYWRLVTEEEFDRYKKEYHFDRYGDEVEIQANENWLGSNLVAISTSDFVQKLLLSRPVDDDTIIIDPLDAVGNWVLFGDGTNLTKDSSNYIEESASINWDISSAGGTTAGIQNTSLDSFDISDYLMEGSVFVWAYITSTTNLTNFIIRIGNDSSNYYYITVTTNSESNSFHTGWNLLRFSFVNKVETGSVTEASCDYVVLYMTKAAGKISETDYRFDSLMIKKGDHYDVIYYSKYGWQSSTGTYLENSTADTDLLNADTDEFDLISCKTAELIERGVLKNKADAEVLRRDYETKKAKYVFDNPSEALMLIQNYHDLSPNI